MKHLLILLTIIMTYFPQTGNGQNIGIPETRIGKDSIKGEPFELRDNWLFTNDDDSLFAQPEYDDSKWARINDPKFDYDANKKEHIPFNGKGWFRLHISIDSNIQEHTFSLAAKHYGASEIYVDGKKIETFGVIKDKEHSEYYNPQRMPMIVELLPGKHVISVRYANYNGQKNYTFFREETPGFLLLLSYAPYTVQEHFYSTTTYILLGTFFNTFFLAFFLLHFTHYLFNKKERANLYFSTFCLSFFLLFLSLTLRGYLNEPIILLLNANNIALISSVGVCISLSGFLNELFGSLKKRFKIIAAASVLTITLWFISAVPGVILCFLLMVTVFIEASVLIIDAMRRRMPGAYIVGIGILILTLSLLLGLITAFIINFNVYLGPAVGSVVTLLFLSIPVTMSIYLSKKYAQINKSLDLQLRNVEELSAKTLQQEIEKQRLLESRQEELEHEVEQRTAEIKSEKKKSDDLLRNILPEEVAEELKQKGSSEAKYFDHVSVLFTDFVNFTKAGERMTPQELVDELHTCFKAFDDICSKYGIEKIKTIGDAYLAVCGLPVSDPEHAINTTKAAIEIREFIAARHAQMPDKTFAIRIGIHSGPVVAGIVGVKKFAYDIWGDTVNTGARMEQHGEAGKINISQNTYDLVKEQFICTFRGQISAKNKGELNMYFVEGVK